MVDSRLAEDGVAIRRRRVCADCGHRFTTYERVEEIEVVVQKRTGQREPFDPAKIIAGLKAATKSRPVTNAQLADVALDVEEQLRLSRRPTVRSVEIGLAVLERLRELDQVAYVRFASVYKGFTDPTDFEREITLLAELPEQEQEQEERAPSDDAPSGSSATP